MKNISFLYKIYEKLPILKEKRKYKKKNDGKVFYFTFFILANTFFGPLFDMSVSDSKLE